MLLNYLLLSSSVHFRYAASSFDLLCILSSRVSKKKVISVLVRCTVLGVTQYCNVHPTPFLLGDQDGGGAEYAKQLASSGPVQSPRVGSHRAPPKSGQDKLGRSLSWHLVTDVSSPPVGPAPHGDASYVAQSRPDCYVDAHGQVRGKLAHM